MGYRWPGNVRELRNTLESMMVLSEGDVLTERDLPDRILNRADRVPARPEAPANRTIEEMERRAIAKALEEARGRRVRAAAALGISVRTLQRKLRQYQLEAQAVPPNSERA
jgi:DNA-binding NtrC family response regulator